MEIAIAGASRSSEVSESPTRKAKAQAGRILYIECKTCGLTGDARIGRVTFSRTGRTFYYGGQTFQSLQGAGFKSNYCSVEIGEGYWTNAVNKRIPDPGRE